MNMDYAEPKHLAPEEHYHGKLEVNLNGGFSWIAAMKMVPVPGEDYQVVLDIGESGTVSDRLQCFLDRDLALCFRIARCMVRLPRGQMDVFLNRWLTLGLFAKLAKGQLQMEISVNNKVGVKDRFEYTGATTLGDQCRIGQALSGGRGIELYLLSVLAWSKVLTKNERGKLFKILVQRWIALRPN
jgi:hypothetical protein